MNNYHDYVIKDGRFIGQFEEMYQECEDPWEASKEDYDASACSVTTKRFIHEHDPCRVVSFGSGKGQHLAWLDCDADGVEISETAALEGQLDHPLQYTVIDTILHFLQTDNQEYDVYLFREVLWYLLPDLDTIWTILDTRHGAWVVVELSFYDDQKYGREYFDGPDDFLNQFPFPIVKIVREHTSLTQREGRVLVIGRVL